MGVIFDDILGKLREGEDLSQYALLGNTPQFLVVADITALTGGQCDELRAGDVVIERPGMANNILIDTAYTVVFKNTPKMEMYLVYVDNTNITCVHYSHDGLGNWYYMATETNNLDRLVTDSITSLTSAQVAALSPGDVVLYDHGTNRDAYLVTQKDDTDGVCSLVCCKATFVSQYVYEKSGGSWSYSTQYTADLSRIANKADKTAVVELTGADLVITPDDNTLYVCHTDLTSLEFGAMPLVPADVGYDYLAQVDFRSDGATQLTDDGDIDWVGDDVDIVGGVPVFVPKANKSYIIMFVPDNSGSIRGIVNAVSLLS